MNGDFGGGFRQTRAPVNEGDELTVTIEAVGEKGDGLAKKDGFVLFVPNTKEGQTVKVKVTKVLRKVGFADVVGEGSPEDVAPNEEAPLEDSESFGDEPAEDSDSFGDEAEEDAKEAEEESTEEDTKEAEEESTEEDTKEAEEESTEDKKE